MEPPGEPGTLGELQGPDSCIPSPRGKRRDGAIVSTIIIASGRSFPGPEVGNENDSCAHELPSKTRINASARSFAGPEVGSKWSDSRSP